MSNSLIDQSNNQHVKRQKMLVPQLSRSAAIDEDQEEVVIPNISKPETATEIQNTQSRLVRTPGPSRAAVTMHTTRLFVDTTKVFLDRRQIAKDMAMLYSQTKAVAVDLLDDVECSSNNQLQNPATLVPESNRYPEIRLHYKQLFGVRKSHAIKSHHSDRTSTYLCIVGMIGAFLFKKIFEKCPALKQPEAIIESLQDAVGSSAMCEHIANELKAMGWCLPRPLPDLADISPRDNI